mmetsp:Transcript_8240/g.15518  ORF Transcript_8240/g.15518 Transcript_8240/m.15518 type:complete len:1113 (-) Transcript_8240:252-3590(-)
MVSSKCIRFCCIHLMMSVAFVTILLTSSDNLNHFDLFASRKSLGNCASFMIIAVDISSTFIKSHSRSKAKTTGQTIRALLESLFLLKAATSTTTFGNVATATDAEPCCSPTTRSHMYIIHSEHRYPQSAKHRANFGNSIEKFEPPIVGHTSVRIYTSLRDEERCGRAYGYGAVENESHANHNLNHEYRIQVLEVPRRAIRSLNDANVAAEYDSKLFAYAPFFHSEVIPVNSFHRKGISDCGDLKRTCPLKNVVKVPRRKCSNINGAAISHEICRQILLVKIWKVQLDPHGFMVHKVLVGSELKVLNYLDQSSEVLFHFHLKQLETEGKRNLYLGYDVKNRFTSPLVGTENYNATIEQKSGNSTVFSQRIYSDEGKHRYYYDYLLAHVYYFMLAGITLMCCITFRYTKFNFLHSTFCFASGIIFHKLMTIQKQDEQDPCREDDDLIIVSPDVFITSTSPKGPQRARVHEKKMILSTTDQTSTDEWTRFFSSNSFEQLRQRAFLNLHGGSFESTDTQLSNRRTDSKCTNSETLRSPPAIQRIGNHLCFSPSDKYPYSLCSYHLPVMSKSSFQTDEKQNSSRDMIHRNSYTSASEPPPGNFRGSSTNVDWSEYETETSSYEQQAKQATIIREFVLHDTAEQQESRDKVSEIHDSDIEHCTLQHCGTFFARSKSPLAKDNVEKKNEEISNIIPPHSSFRDGLDESINPSAIIPWNDNLVSSSAAILGEVLDDAINDIQTNDIQTSNNPIQYHSQPQNLFETSIAPDTTGISVNHSKISTFHAGETSIESDITPRSNYATGCVLQVYSGSKPDMQNDIYSVDADINDCAQSERLVRKKRKFCVLDKLQGQTDMDEATVNEDDDIRDEVISLETTSSLDQNKTQKSHDIEKNRRIVPDPDPCPDQCVIGENFIKMDKAIASKALQNIHKCGGVSKDDDDEDFVEHVPPDETNLKMQNDSFESHGDKCTDERMESVLGLNVQTSERLLAFSRLFQAPVWEFCENTVSSLDNKEHIIEKASSCDRCLSNSRYVRNSKRECSKDDTSSSKRVCNNNKRKRSGVGSFSSVPSEIVVHNYAQDSKSALMIAQMSVDFNSNNIEASDNSGISLFTTSSKRSRAY